jgi:pilus assembly protein Flp/PilA
MKSTRTMPSKVMEIVASSVQSTGAIVLNVCKRTNGQDLIEYALMAGFVAVAAGAIMPGVASQISTIFSKVSSALVAAGS